MQRVPVGAASHVGTSEEPCNDVIQLSWGQQPRAPRSSTGYIVTKDYRDIVRKQPP